MPIIEQTYDILQLKAKIRQIWINLTDIEVMLYDISRDRFLDVVQKKYGLRRTQVDTTLSHVERQCRIAKPYAWPTAAAQYSTQHP